MPSPRNIEASSAQIDIDRAISTVRRRAWLMAAVAAIGTTVTIGVALFLPAIYRAAVGVVVESERVPEGFTRTMSTRTVTSRAQEVTQEMLSDERLLALVDRYGLYPDLRADRPADEVARRMRDDIVLKLDGVPTGVWKDGEVAFTLTYTGTDAQTAVAVANDLAATYIDEDQKARLRQRQLIAEFLQTEINTMKTKLEAQEQAVKSFKESHPGEQREHQAANLATIERLGGQLLLNTQKQATAGEPELATLKAEEERLTQLIALYEKRVESTPQNDLELAALERDRAAFSTVYNTLLRLYEEANVAARFEQNQERERYRIFDPALVGERPAQPDRTRLLVIGLLLSLGLAVMAAVARENLDPSVHSADDLRAVSAIPVLAAVPWVVMEDDRRRMWRRQGLRAASLLAGVLVVGALTYLIADQNIRLAALLS